LTDLLKAFDSSLARYRKDGKNFLIKKKPKRRAIQESTVTHSKHYIRTKGAYAFIKKMKAERPLPQTIYQLGFSNYCGTKNEKILSVFAYAS